jgi:hypothetical protein
MIQINYGKTLVSQDGMWPEQQPLSIRPACRKRIEHLPSGTYVVLREAAIEINDGNKTTHLRLYYFSENIDLFTR